MERGFYVCDGCQLSLHLLGPVDRPCPNCGGDFILTEEPIYHPMQAYQRDEEKRSFGSREEWAEHEATAYIDEVIEGFEKLLAGS